jgi:hypothetical protein
VVVRAGPAGEALAPVAPPAAAPEPAQEYETAEVTPSTSEATA